MASEQVTTVDSDQKTSWGERICFFFCNLGNIPLSVLLSSYFLIFYTDVVGLSAGALATLFLVSKVMDAVSDPIMGYLIDRFPVTKHGKFRPLLILGTIICSINYALLWFGAVWSPVYKYVIVYATYLCFGWTFDIMDISLTSLMSVMTTDNKERTTLSTVKGFGFGIGVQLILIAAPLIVAEETLQSYYILIFGCLAVVVVCSIVGALGVKERVSFTGSSKGESSDDTFSVKDLLKMLIMQPILVYFVANLCTAVGSSTFNSASTYYYTYVVGDLTVAATVNTVGVVAMVLGTIAVPVLVNKLGSRKKAFVVGMVIVVVGYVIRCIAPTSVAAAVVGTTISTFGADFYGPVGYGIQADNTTYVQYKTGKHAEGSVASLSSLNSKLGQGIGGAIPGYVLEWTGYDASLEVQGAAATNGILASTLYIPIVLYAVAGILMIALYPLDNQQVDDMAAEIVVREQAEQE